MLRPATGVAVAEGGGTVAENVAKVQLIVSPGVKPLALIDTGPPGTGVPPMTRPTGEGLWARIPSACTVGPVNAIGAQATTATATHHCRMRAGMLRRIFALPVRSPPITSRAPNEKLR